jgi:hypothetical protein
LRTPLIIALAATLVGCSRQAPHPAASESCTDKHGFACFNRTAADQPFELASFKINPLTKETKFTIAKTEKPPSHRARDAHLAIKKAKPTIIAGKAEPPARRIPLPPPSLRTQLEPKSSATAGSGTTRSNIADSHPTVGLAPNSNGRTIQEQVAAATAVAERRTTDLLVAVVMVRPEITSVSDLTGKNIAIDDRYSASRVDVRIAIVASGGSMVELSVGHTTAIDRLVKGEVPAAVLALVSADAAEGFPEIAGFRIFHIPLSLRSLKARP